LVLDIRLTLNCLHAALSPILGHFPTFLLHVLHIHLEPYLQKNAIVLFVESIRLVIGVVIGVYDDGGEGAIGVVCCCGCGFVVG